MVFVMLCLAGAVGSFVASLGFQMAQWWAAPPSDAPMRDWPFALQEATFPALIAALIGGVVIAPLAGGVAHIVLSALRLRGATIYTVSGLGVSAGLPMAAAYAPTAIAFSAPEPLFLIGGGLTGFLFWMFRRPDRKARAPQQVEHGD